MKPALRTKSWNSARQQTLLQQSVVVCLSLETSCDSAKSEDAAAAPARVRPRVDLARYAVVGAGLLAAGTEAGAALRA